MAATCVGLATQLFPGHFLPFLHWPHFDQSLGHTHRGKAGHCHLLRRVARGNWQEHSFNGSGSRPGSATRRLFFAPLQL